MAELAALGTALASAVGEVGVGTALSAASSVAGGVAANAAGNAQAKALKASADFKSKELERAAAEETAKATRRRAEEEHKTSQIIGRRVALSASGGAGATGGSEDSTLEGIFAQGQYNEDAAVASGLNRAAGLKSQADAGQYDAQMAANLAKSKGQAALITGVVGAAGKVAGNMMKLGGLYGSDEEDDVDPDSGWRTSVRYR